MRKIYIAVIAVFLLVGCSSSSKKNPHSPIYFFDLKSYFSKQADIFNQHNTMIKKTVTKNEISEIKQIKIKDWKIELALFIDADINKPAWRDSYSKDSSTTKIIYTAKDKELKTQKIEIDLANKIPYKFKITNQVNNLLYQTKENLEFYPDSLYKIVKQQKVILLGVNNYLIEGRF